MESIPASIRLDSFNKITNPIRSSLVHFIDPSFSSSYNLSLHSTFTLKILEFYEEWLSVPYPCNQFYEIIATTTVDSSFPGGCIFSTNLLYDSRNIHDKIYNTHFIFSYYIAKSWFQSALTLQSKKDDQWIIESLSYFLSLLYLESIFGKNHVDYFDLLISSSSQPSFHHLLSPNVFLRSHCPKFLLDDSPTNIRIIRLLSNKIGVSLLQKILYEILHEPIFSTLSFLSFLDKIDNNKKQEEQLSHWMNQWLYHPKTSKLELCWSYNPLKKYNRIYFHQLQNSNIFTGFIHLKIVEFDRVLMEKKSIVKRHSYFQYNSMTSNVKRFRRKMQDRSIPLVTTILSGQKRKLEEDEQDEKEEKDLLTPRPLFDPTIYTYQPDPILYIVPDLESSFVSPILIVTNQINLIQQIINEKSIQGQLQGLFSFYHLFMRNNIQESLDFYHHTYWEIFQKYHLSQEMFLDWKASVSKFRRNFPTLALNWTVKKQAKQYRSIIKNLSTQFIDKETNVSLIPNNAIQELLLYHNLWVKDQSMTWENIIDLLISMIKNEKVYCYVRLVIAQMFVSMEKEQRPFEEYNGGDEKEEEHDTQLRYTNIVLNYFYEQYYDSKGEIWHTNDFRNLSSYHMKIGLISILSTSLTSQSHTTPMKIVRFLLSLVEENDNYENPYNDHEYLKVLKTSLANCQFIPHYSPPITATNINTNVEYITNTTIEEQRKYLEEACQQAMKRIEFLLFL